LKFKTYSKYKDRLKYADEYNEKDRKRREINNKKSREIYDKWYRSPYKDFSCWSDKNDVYSV
jgi:hypothetical protein